MGKPAGPSTVLSWRTGDGVKHSTPSRRVARDAHPVALVAQQAGELAGGGAGHAAKVASAASREKD